LWAAWSSWFWSAGVPGRQRIWGVRPVSVEEGWALSYPGWRTSGKRPPAIVDYKEDNSN
jgi:hypothetical protein